MSQDVGELLKKNKFWAALGLVAVAEVGIYFYLVEGKAVEVAELREQLNTQLGDLETLANKKGEFKNKKWLDQLDENLKRHEQAAKDTQAVFKSRDAALEKWFDGSKINANGFPDLGHFHAVYTEKLEALRLRVAAEKVTQGLIKDAAAFFLDAKAPHGGFVIDDKPGDGDGPAMRKLMKRYWIQEALGQAMIDAPVTGLRAIAFQEPYIPKGETDHMLLPVIVQVELPFPALGKFIAATLRQPQVMFQVKGVEAVKGAPVDIVVKQHEYEDEQLNLGTSDDAIFPEPPVAVTLELEVVDFEFKD